MPLGHLIALISNAHLMRAGIARAPCSASSFRLLLGMVSTAYRKTSLHRDRPNGSRGQRSRSISTMPSRACAQLARLNASDDADFDPASQAYPFFTMSRTPRGLHAADAVTLPRLDVCAHREVWWSQTGSNRRPPACKAGALPTELWPRLDLRLDLPGKRSREDPATKGMVGLERFELPTSRLSSARSNQLSYRPGKRGVTSKRRKRNEGGGVPQMYHGNRSTPTAPCVSKRTEKVETRDGSIRIKVHP